MKIIEKIKPLLSDLNEFLYNIVKYSI